MQNNINAGNQNFNSEWTTSEMTLSAFVALHGDCKPKQVNTTDGVRHSIDAADGTSALFSNKLESLLDEAKASGKIIVIPADGIGTGKAVLQEKAPRCFEYLQSELQKL